MDCSKKLDKIRREYGTITLIEEKLPLSPIDLFRLWLEEAIAKIPDDDPTAMVLSTTDYKGHPDSRVVLLKEQEDETFIFYTNYHSKKAMQLNQIPFAALNFYWPQLARQVRIRGRVKRVSNKKSMEYFSSRPIASQIGAIISPQSEEIPNRTKLERDFDNFGATQQLIQKPKFWGGYELRASKIEFWQGRDNRLHDRIFYYKKKGKWCRCRLAP